MRLALVVLPAFGVVHGRGGAVVAGTDLVRGLGRLAGMAVSEVAGATGYLDTDYAAKAWAGLDALARFDVAAIHVAAPNEAALDGDYEAKVDALERIDERLLGTLLDRIGKLDLTAKTPDFARSVWAGQTTATFQDVDPCALLEGREDEHLPVRIALGEDGAHGCRKPGGVAVPGEKDGRDKRGILPAPGLGTHALE